MIAKRIIEFMKLWTHCCFSNDFHGGALGIRIGTKLAWDLAEIIVR